jgi:hypothetical protein
MSQVKHYIIYLAVKGPDGHRVASRLITIPTGSSDIDLVSLWILLEANLRQSLHTLKLEEVASSHGNQVRELENL